MPATINDFRKTLSALALKQKLIISPWQGATRRSPNLLQMNTEPRPSILYVKFSNSNPGFWGLTKNQIDLRQRVTHLVNFQNAISKIKLMEEECDECS
jgi:hypothetical protein